MKHHLHRFRVTFDLVDPGGRLFFAHLFTAAHRAYESLLAEAGLALGRLAETGPLLPLVHAEADYLAPVGLEDEVEVQVNLEALGRSSFTLVHRFRLDDRPCARARTVHVAISPDDGRPVPLPGFLIDALRPYGPEGN